MRALQLPIGRLRLFVDAITSIFDLSGTYLVDKYRDGRSDLELLESDYRAVAGDLHVAMRAFDLERKKGQMEMFGAEAPHVE